MDWSKAGTAAERAARVRSSRAEHVALAEGHAGDFCGAMRIVVDEVRSRACAHEWIGAAPGGFADGLCYYQLTGRAGDALPTRWRELSHAVRLKIVRDEAGHGRHPAVRFVRRTLEACWDRLALAVWAHAEQGQEEVERFLAQARVWGESGDEWSPLGRAGWSEREDAPQDVGLPVWGEHAWSRPGGVWRMPGVCFLGADYDMDLALKDLRPPGATAKLREGICNALDTFRPLETEHSGLPLGCLTELMWSWHQYLNWMLLSFDHCMERLGPWLLSEVEEHKRTGIWLLDTPDG